MSIPNTMKALVARGVNDYALMQVDTPTLHDGDILIKVEACGICAGDIKASHGTARFCVLGRRHHLLCLRARRYATDLWLGRKRNRR